MEKFTTMLQDTLKKYEIPFNETDIKILENTFSELINQGAMFSEKDVAKILTSFHKDKENRKKTESKLQEILGILPKKEEKKVEVSKKEEVKKVKAQVKKEKKDTTPTWSAIVKEEPKKIIKYKTGHDIVAFFDKKPLGNTTITIKDFYEEHNEFSIVITPVQKYSITSLVKFDEMLSLLKDIGFTLQKANKQVTLVTLSYIDTYSDYKFNEQGDLIINDIMFLMGHELNILKQWKDKKINVITEFENSFIVRDGDIEISLDKALNNIAYKIYE